MNETDKLKSVKWDESLIAKFSASLGYSPTKNELTIAQRIYEYLQENRQFHFESTLMAAVTGKRTTKVAILRKLVEVEIICRIGEGLRNAPFKYCTDVGIASSLAKIENSDPPSVASIEQVGKKIAEPTIVPIQKTQTESFEMSKTTYSPSELDEIATFYKLLLATKE